VRTGHTGLATIQFPDGSITRLASDTTVTIQAAQLNSSGTLKSASLLQKIGRTFSTVQKLAGGATYQVGGHSVSAEVRGTQFEVLVRSDGTNQFKVFDGKVQISGRTTVTLNAGQQIDVDANGNLGPPQAIQPDRQDQYVLAAACANAVSQGTTAGTAQTTTGGPVSSGQTVEVDYNSPGGNVSVALCWPGSSMILSITDPTGAVRQSRGGASPIIFPRIPGPPGTWRATVRALSVPGGEPFAVSFATDLGCSGGNVDTGSVVRETLSNGGLSRNLAQSGVSGVTIQVQGTSPSSARVYYSSSINGFDFSWTIDFYAATPDLGFVFTQVTVHGINITTQFVSRLNAAGAAVTSIPADYTVDRVYSCIGPDGDMMVIEGHR
jgi:FecR protein